MKDVRTRSHRPRTGKGVPVSRADLIRAIEFLGIRPSDSKQFESLLETLGFALKQTGEPDQEPGERVIEDKPEAEARAIVEEPWTTPSPGESSTREHWEPPPQRVRQRKLRPARLRRPEPPPELLRMPVLPEESESRAPTRLPLEPLFNPRWSRHIVSGALSVRRPEGPLDVEAICRQVGRGEAFREVPRRLWPTLKRRLQVLVDYGEGMEPFHRDQQRLLEDLRKVVGSPRSRSSGSSTIPAVGSEPV